MTYIERDRGYKLILLIFSLAMIFLSLLSPSLLIEFAIKGLDMCGRCVIPSLFPFMIFSDMLISSDVFNNIPRKIGIVFEKLFKLPMCAMGAFFIGVLCGFPLGVKHACDLYSSGNLSKEQCERLVCFVNNTGPSFIIAGVGVSMRKSVFEGALLYLIQIVSSIVCGLLISKNATYKSAERKHFTSQDDFSFSESIKRSALNCVYISGFITFFSIACGFSQHLINNDVASAVLSSFLEIGNASSVCAKLDYKALSFSLSAFAISFSGLSVHMQSKVFTDKTDINLKKYYFSKLFQAILSFFVALVISFIR